MDFFNLEEVILNAEADIEENPEEIEEVLEQFEEEEIAGTLVVTLLAMGEIYKKRTGKKPKMAEFAKIFS